MMARNGPSRGKGLQTVLRYVAVAVVGMLILIGIALISNGIWIKVKAELAQIMLERAFEKSRAGEVATHQAVKPWHWADMAPIARLSSHRLGENAIVLDNVSGEALAFGPGHMVNTPLPGEPGTSILAAHRDTHFSWIGKLRQGDRIEVETIDNIPITFVVERSWIATHKNPGINIIGKKAKIALTTCYPFGATERGPWRYIVEATMMDEGVVAEAGLDQSKLNNMAPTQTWLGLL